VWKGPLPGDLGVDETALTKLAVDHGAEAVIIDSLKDAAVDLVKDDVGSRINRGLQLAVATGIEVCGIHHQRKGVGGAKPKKLEDVYGSSWLTSGVGSVVLLWGEPGDPVVQLTHLKQPAEPVGPLTIVHDHAAGVTVVQDRPDPLEILRRAHRGITARVMAGSLYGSHDPGANDIEKARRQLDRLVKDRLAYRQDGATGGHDKTPATWFATTLQEEF
jgi:replicative DNA helicase